jgi:hypothetical protein
VQVEPMKPTLKAHGTKHLKLKRNILLSTSTFRFNLRCFATDATRLFRTGYFPGLGWMMRRQLWVGRATCYPPPGR